MVSYCMSPNIQKSDINITMLTMMRMTSTSLMELYYLYVSNAQKPNNEKTTSISA